ncbi:MAG TPA: TonB-dependent receptor [Flavobacterium sp.]
MTFKKLFLLLALLLCQIICAQYDTVNNLQEVVVDRQLRNFSGTQHVLSLNDSVIHLTAPSLTSLLSYNSTIYFKENGYGMVSSPSFRGTTAQQTAVVWNGININSQLNGQSDFNTINTGSISSVTVRAGGGSSIYGSSAIGGSIHLNDEISFGRGLRHLFRAGYGSFNTFDAAYRISVSSEKVGFNASASHISSENDFEYHDGNRKNINGQFGNTSLGISLGYKINPNNSIRFFSRYFNGDRHFALVFPTDTKSRYRDQNTANLLEWENKSGKITSRLKTALISEEYRFFENIESDSYFYGKARTFIGKYDAQYEWNDILLNAIADYSTTGASGSDIGDETRNIASVAFLMKHRPMKKLHYEISARKEFTETYRSPFLFSAGLKYDLTRHYSIKFNASRNFRIPTFNDLYWHDGGNRDLRPETSLQAEIGNNIHWNTFTFSVTGYYIRIKDMIQWLPGTSASWNPQNVNRVRSYGVETLASWKQNFGRHNFHLNAAYAYTVSENEETHYQLIYVPYHKITAGAAYSVGRFSAASQLLFTGEVFTRSDNNTRYNLDAYSVTNFALDYTVDKAEICTIGFRVNNLFDQEYQVTERRPFPGRHYNLNLTFNF